MTCRTKEKLEKLLPADKWLIHHKEILHYGFTARGGYGMTLEKL